MWTSGSEWQLNVSVRSEAWCRIWHDVILIHFYEHSSVGKIILCTSIQTLQQQQQQQFHSHLLGTTWVSRYQEKHSPTHIYYDHQPSFVTASSIYYDPQHKQYSNQSICKLDSLCTTSLQVLFGPLPLGIEPSTSYSIISSPNRYFLFTTHSLTDATCFAVVPRLWHLFLVSLCWNSAFYLNLTRPMIIPIWAH